MELCYSSEKNIQIVISLLKANNIRRVIISPGGTNVAFVASLQCDSFFELYSCIDERSAAYMACGMAAETNEPVVLSCTGATSSRNYMPALTEAFYRKLPILAITSHCGEDRLYNLHPQQIDRNISPNDVFVKKVHAVTVTDGRSFRNCELEVNRAILALIGKKAGPVHINLYTNFQPDFSKKELPLVRRIEKFTEDSSLPDIKYDTIAIFIGSHKRFSEIENQAIDKFCECYNAVVIADHTSGYQGKYKVNITLSSIQNNYRSKLLDFDLLIHFGEISGDYYSCRVRPKMVWRVNPDGEIRDTFNNLSSVFEMDEMIFCSKYTVDRPIKENFFYKDYVEEYNQLYNQIPDLPLSNIWIAKELAPQIPENSKIHFGILNSLRSWNFFNINKGIIGYSNVGGFGIDGMLSSMLGASFVNRDTLFFGVLGDLAFFYDLNSLGSRHISGNVRILLINNGKGTEFKNKESFAYQFGDEADLYIAASGHNASMSRSLVKHFSEDMGFTYLTASTKSEVIDQIPIFINRDTNINPILFEVFTDSEDETNALDSLFNLVPAQENDSAQESFTNKIKHSIKRRYNNTLDHLKIQ